LGAWADALALGEVDRRRWRAAGQLHDVLRDEDPRALRSLVPGTLRGLPGQLLHGPAAAERLREEGVADTELLDAVAYHTIGDVRLATLGRALYAADFLEPERTFLADWRAGLRARMPDELRSVVAEIARARVENLRTRGSPVLPETHAFVSMLTSEAE
jgi:2-amino-4-hydroxy-6-hydroxymethyldihydropteridine diphosphokinase